ncbi:hypothetical protein OG455_41530 [Kitasatospora sp. NBC_01287]|uniref:hypothetical protein n=1 Tax=Kitasatospora sp. NBC_01287 TaxID=2903573 RepID=UPI002258057B|nr:hypothetical protein [Kitasatospora sp. NBC_01287]MCX4750966.1 hypothetical protein [Kitasatospora sp. NBC_01287]MCX4751783.1 hypothetical protein [Kitasatospora sp. NBC_01287]MCX4751925.1 hypothetical protein [Kitasatospora sp. NBC_01287]
MSLAIGQRVRTLIDLDSADWAPEQPDIPADRLPTSFVELAYLMVELDQQAVPGQPDPSIGLWKRLQAQEGYDIAAPLWRDACNYCDHLMSSEDDDREPCGEGMCHCYCPSREHACGCDCPRDEDGQLVNL